MILREFFDDRDGEVIKNLRSQVTDELLRLVTNGVEEIEMAEVASLLRQARTGMIIDRGLIMRVLDPNECKAVKSIEGNKILLSFPADELQAKAEDDKQRDAEAIQKRAMDVAKKSIGA